jgi:hypothetical protein
VRATLDFRMEMIGDVFKLEGRYKEYDYIVE